MTESDELLHRAIKQGRYAEMQAALRSGADVCASDAEGYSALHWAIIRLQYKMAEEVLVLGATPNTVANSSWGPVHHAAACGEPSYLKLLSRHGANMFALTDKGQSPLYVAIHFSTPEVAEFLVGCGSDVNQTREGNVPILFDAIGLSEMGHAALLLKHGANANACNPDGKPVYAAAKSADVLILFRAHGATLDPQLTYDKHENWGKLTVLRACVAAGMAERVLGRLQAGELDGESLLELVKVAQRVKQPEMAALIHAHMAKQTMAQIRANAGATHAAASR